MCLIVSAEKAARSTMHLLPWEKWQFFNMLDFIGQKPFKCCSKNGDLANGRDAPDCAHHGVAAERADGRIGET